MTAATSMRPMCMVTDGRESLSSTLPGRDLSLDGAARRSSGGRRIPLLSPRTNGKPEGWRVSVSTGLGAPRWERGDSLADSSGGEAGGLSS